ncbi:hypothetical protein VIGAN_04173100, partial [Vigna angularis var. angularis]
WLNRGNNSFPLTEPLFSNPSSLVFPVIEPFFSSSHSSRAFPLPVWSHHLRFSNHHLHASTLLCSLAAHITPSSLLLMLASLFLFSMAHRPVFVLCRLKIPNSEWFFPTPKL